jgi:hypothetical protein
VRSRSCFLLFALVACSADEGGPPVEDPPGTPACADGEADCVGWQTCPAEFAPDAVRGGCREVVPEGECAAGEMPVLGQAACQPIGPATCAEGFTKSAGGWGCDTVLPAVACSGATRDALGSASCVPVGDCSAAFPPAEATYFVDAAYADADLGPNKFRTITAALNAAPAGSTIAIETGTYAGGIVAKHDNTTLVGRCADEVRLVGTGTSLWGVLANGKEGIVVRGVTLEDHYEGVRAQYGGTLTITDSIIESPRSTGIIAWEPGSRVQAERIVIRNVKPQPGSPVPVFSVNADGGGVVELVDSAVTGSMDAGVVATNAVDPVDEPSTLKLTRTVVRDTNLDEHSDAGGGVVVSGNSRAEVVESAVVDTRRIALVAVAYEGVAPPSLVVTHSIVRGTLEDGSGNVASGAYATGAGAGITLEDVSFHQLVQTGLLTDTGGSITLRRGVVVGTRAGADGYWGMGAWAAYGGHLVIEDSALVDNAYYGAGLYGAGTDARLAGVLVAGTRRDKDDHFGRGVNVEFGASMEMDRVTFIGNGDESVFVRGETAEAARANATATRLLIRDTVSRADGSLGSGINVEMGAYFEADGVAVVRARRAGILVNESLGEAGSPAEAVLAHAVVRETQPAGDALEGPGIAIAGAGVASGGLLTVRSSAIVDNVQFGLVASGPGARTLVESSVIGGTTPEAGGSYGHGVVVLGGSALVARKAIITDNQIGLAFDASAGIVTNTLVQRNAVGIQAQQGSTLTEAREPPGDPTPSVVLVTEDTRFIDNQTRVGSGAVPLPNGVFEPSIPGGTPSGEF